MRRARLHAGVDRHGRGLEQDSRATWKKLHAHPRAGGWHGKPCLDVAHQGHGSQLPKDQRGELRQFAHGEPCGGRYCATEERGAGAAGELHQPDEGRPEQGDHTH